MWLVMGGGISNGKMFMQLKKDVSVCLDVGKGSTNEGRKASCTAGDSLVLVPAAPETEAANQVGAVATETTPEESAQENPVPVPQTAPNQRAEKLFKAHRKKRTFLSLFLHHPRQKVKVSERRH